jgi:large subunit ribosomal protein L5e
MGFVKVQKNKAYFKRYQVKYRRRREGKTDYFARKRLIIQDKNKYNSPKYRLVVRLTNTDVIAQIIYAKINGDYVLSAAYAHELPAFGMPVGLTNYAAAYATGLLLARRVLTKLNLADKYKGNDKVNGEDYNVQALTDGPAPFRAILDVGLARTTTGNKIFAVMKGALDGGVEVPHSETRFVGYEKEGKKLNAETLRKHIFGLHVKEYADLLKKENPDKFNKQFSQYTKKNIDPSKLDATWAAVHKAIKANPVHKSKAKPAPQKQKHYSKRKLTLVQKKDKVRQRLASQARKTESQE